MAKIAKKEDELAENDQKKTRNRSPNHPLFNLEDALNKAGQLHEGYGMHSIAVNLAHKKWGYAEHGSIGNQCIAALKSYGLLSVDGKGKSRKIQLTDSVDRIIRNAPDRSNLLERAAKSPTIHTEILEEYSGKGLPPDDVLKQYLVWERDGGRFNEDVVDSFIERLRETLEFSGLGTGQESDGGLEVDTLNNGNGPETLSAKVQVGSFVQWTSQGVHQFPESAKITRIDKQPDGTEYAYFEEKDGYAPMTELAIAGPKKVELNLLTPALTAPPAKSLSDPISSGPVVRFPLDGGSNEVEIRLKKPVSKKDFDRITQLLALSEDSLVISDGD